MLAPPDPTPPPLVKLAIVSETFPPEINGVAMTFGIIARELGRRGHGVTIFRPWRPDLPPPAAHPEYREVTLPGAPLPGYPLLRLGWPARRRLERCWRRDPPDLVHVATEGPLGASAVTAARALALPVTSSFHTNFHAYAACYGIAPLRRLILAWLRRVHNRTRRTFVPDPGLGRTLAAHGFTRLGLLSRGVDTRLFSPARRAPALRAGWGAADGDPVAIHVGRMAAEKNYAAVFRAYDAMRAANPRLRCVLAGEGPLKARLQREHPECAFAGIFPREEIGRYYASADLYIHASLTETFGNVVIEALASGLAVAAFDYAAARQFIRHGENGLLVACDQPEALVAAGVQLARDAPLRRRLGRAAAASLAGQSWEIVVRRFEADLQAAAAR